MRAVSDRARGRSTRCAEDALHLTWEYHTGDPTVDDAAAGLRSRRESAEVEARRLAEETSALARQLVAEGRYSVRDAAALVAVSPSRIGQLAPKRPARHRPRPEALSAWRLPAFVECAVAT